MRHYTAFLLTVRIEKMKAHQNITVIPTAKFHLENSAVTVRSFNMRKILLHLTPKEEPTSIF